MDNIISYYTSKIKRFFEKNREFNKILRRGKICFNILCFLYYLILYTCYSPPLFSCEPEAERSFLAIHTADSATRKTARAQRKIIPRTPSNIGSPANERSPYQTVKNVNITEKIYPNAPCFLPTKYISTESAPHIKT